MTGSELRSTKAIDEILKAKPRASIKNTFLEGMFKSPKESNDTTIP